LAGIGREGKGDRVTLAKRLQSRMDLWIISFPADWVGQSSAEKGERNECKGFFAQ
jgi:hypothetical protein